MEKKTKKRKRIDHGTFAGYTHGPCRCRRCKNAAAEYARHYRARSQSLKTLTHGTRSAYNNGCRCEPCTEANRTYARLWKRR